MHLRRTVAIAPALFALSLLVAVRHDAIAATRPSAFGAAPDDACALLTEDQVNAAIDVKTLPGQHVTPTSTKQCLWSDAKANTDHRRVTLGIIARRSFDLGKQNTIAKIEPATGVGDEAYYMVYKADAPTLVVRKGETAIDVRVLNGSKLKAFSLDELKAKELNLAKAAVARL